MKRFASLVLVALMGLTLVACGGSSTNSSESPSDQGQVQSEETAQEQDASKGAAQVSDQSSPEDIIAAIQADFSATQQNLLDKQADVYEQVGDTYDGYVANAQAVQDWYDLAVSETEALGQRTLENARLYYMAVVNTVDHEDSDALEAAMDDLYDLIYDDAFDDYYDAIYDEAFDDVYDKYYDGIIDDAYDSVEYDEWYETKSDAYEAWFDAKSDVYDGWFDAKSDVYSEWFDVNSDFYSKEFDVAKTLRLDEQQ